MGKKGKNRQEEDYEPKKKVITEDQLMDKTHMDWTQFTTFLPEDSLYGNFIFTDRSARVLRKIVADLNNLLYLEFKSFWATLLYNPTLKPCLTTCISYLHRPWLNTYVSGSPDIKLDFSHEMIRNMPEYELTEALAKVILTIYYRIVHFTSENLELSQLYKLGESISTKFILDLPRLFELAELYAQSNPNIIKTIVRLYSQTLPTFYAHFTEELLPRLQREVGDVSRQLKIVSDREQFGINYSETRLHGKETSPAEEQLKRKVNLLMRLVSFDETVTNISALFPATCAEYCYFNQNMQLAYENIFFELEVAYQLWSYQGQEAKLLPILNYLLERCKSYFVRYFEKVNEVVVLRLKNNPSGEAYLKSFERIIKDYGKRLSVGKKAQNKRSMLLYRLVQKQFDLDAMLQHLYMDELNNQTLGLNIDFLIEFKIALENQLKSHQPAHVPQPEPEQFEPGEETDVEDLKPVKQASQRHAQSVKEPTVDLTALKIMVPKKMREDDYYTNLHKEYGRRCGVEYEDEYDDLVDYDKKPLFIDSDSSNDSESAYEKNLVSNSANRQRMDLMHRKYSDSKNHQPVKERVHRQQQQSRNYLHVVQSYNEEESNQGKGEPRYQEKNTPASKPVEEKKPRYVLKDEQQQQQRDQHSEAHNQRNMEEFLDEPKQQVEESQRRPWKDNRGHNYKPKQDHNEKSRNANKTRPEEGKYRAKR